MNLKTPLSQLTGIGPSLLYKLKRLNLNTLEDLIYHFPFRYDDFSNTTSALEAKIGESVTLQGEIWSIQNIYTRSRKIITKAIFNDGTSPIELTWFNSSWLTKQIKTGDRLQVSGKITKYKNKLSIIAPRWEKLSDTPIHRPTETLHTGRLVPVYPETEGISSKWIRTKIDKLLPKLLSQIQDSLPDQIKDNMLPLTDAIQQIHFPKDWGQAEKARERLGFDELFYVSLATQKARLEWSKKPLIEPLKIRQSYIKDFTSELPFKLTAAQEKALEEILADLGKSVPMNRLIQGEVGSGKTVVAAAVAYLVYKNGLRTLLMAPTEILAFQHYETLKRFLKPFGLKVGIYTGSKKFNKKVSKGKEVSKVSNVIKTFDISDTFYSFDTSTPDIIIGTHALLSEKLALENVGLVIVDEQQRFGVEQRTLLRSKAKIPHFLTMTATPIPRTVALTLYGDLDMSVIDELPKGRQIVKTFVVPEKKRLDSYSFISDKIAKGQQAYIITPLIEASETFSTVKAAKVEFEKLKKIFPEYKLDLLHGRMKGAEKERVTQDFRSGKIQILVSTSVVEVGMDNPNATIIVIEGAERFGLAQLHQLRGRVGRGAKQSYCLLYTSNASLDESRRLKYLETTFDGLKLAELDLKIRGSGQIFGKLQSGRFEFKIASFSNLSLLEKTKQSAQNILTQDPTLDKYPLLKARLQEISSGVMPD